MKKLSLLKAVGIAALTTLLAGCKIVVLQPKGVISADEKQLMIDAVCLMLIVVIPVIILTLLIARRYRASNKKAKYTPDWCHGTLLEIGWWVIPIIIIVILAVMTWRTTHRLDPYRPIATKDKTMTIEAVALRWKWLFIYPQEGIATINYVAFPVNTEVQFLITADAPMNSFQIPALGGQIYAMNGMQTKLHLIATQAGVYHGRSVSFSGQQFAGMKFNAHVTSAADFENWVESVKNGNYPTLDMPSYLSLVKPSGWNKPQFFSDVEPNLFQKIIMSFDQPNKHHVNASFTGVHL